MNISLMALKIQSSETSGSNQEVRRISSSNNFSQLLNQKLSEDRPSIKTEISKTKVNEERAAVKPQVQKRMVKPEPVEMNGREVSKPVGKTTERAEAQNASDNTTQVQDNTSETVSPKGTEAVDATDKEIESTDSKPQANDEASMAQAQPILKLLDFLTESMPVLTNLVTTAPTDDQVALTDLQGAAISEVKASIKNLIDSIRPLLENGNLDISKLQQLDSKAFKVEFENLKNLVDQMLKGGLTPESQLSQIAASMTQLSQQLTNLTSSTNETQPLQTPSINGGSTTSLAAVENTEGPKTVQGQGASPSKHAETNTGDSQNHRDLSGKSETKVKITEAHEASKVHGSNLVTEFQAKLDSASVAFGKTELSQPVKMNLQQLIMDQLTNGSKMQVRTTEAGTFMSMKLNPEVLGNVEIKLEIVKNVLQAEIKVENMIVKGAIETNLSDLKNALSDKGYQVEQLNVSVGDKNAGGRGQQQSSQENGRWAKEMIEEQTPKLRTKADLKESIISYLG